MSIRSPISSEDLLPVGQLQLGDLLHDLARQRRVGREVM